MSDTPNYATPIMDAESGLKFITEVGTLKRLFLHPNCEICGIARLSYGTAPLTCLPECPGRRREQNDNVHPVDAGHGRGGAFIP